ncbi:MAG: protein kinase domain-containing protein, partial [Dermatophilaceae bacterium]
TELYGVSLAGRLRTGPPAYAEACAIALDLLTGLAAVHARGLLHGDVTPSNVMLRAGRAALGDFGTAVFLADASTRAAGGTEQYLAPEVAAGAAATTRSDVFSAALTLRRLFDPLPPGLEPVLTRAASYRAQDRPEDAAALLGRVREALDLPEETRRARADRGTGRTRVVGAAVLVALVLGAGAGTLWMQGGPDERSAGGAAASASASPGSGLSSSGPSSTASPSPPGTAAQVSVLARDRAAEVRWPAATAATTATHWTATATPDADDMPATSCRAPAGAGRCSLDGLVNGVTYRVTVTSAGGGDPGIRPATVVPYPAAVLVAPQLATWLDGADPATARASASCGADPATTAVPCWADRSGRGNDAVQDRAGSRPTLGTVGGKRVLEFTGRDSLVLRRPDLMPAGDSPSTVFVVASAGKPYIGTPRVALFWGPTDGEGRGRVVYKRAASARAQVGVDVEGGASPAPWTEALSLVVGVHEPGRVASWQGGRRAERELAVLDTRADQAIVGGHPEGLGWRGAVAEIIVLNRVVTSAERAAVEDYLARKWGVRPAGSG